MKRLLLLVVLLAFDSVLNQLCAKNQSSLSDL